MAKVTLDDIKDTLKAAQRKEKEKIEADAEKKAEIRQLENLQAELEKIEGLDEATVKAFSKFVDKIISKDGTIPEENPVKDFLEKIQQEAEDHYDSAKAILSESKRG